MELGFPEGIVKKGLLPVLLPPSVNVGLGPLVMTVVGPLVTLGQGGKVSHRVVPELPLRGVTTTGTGEMVMLGCA